MKRYLVTAGLALACLYGIYYFSHQTRPGQGISVSIAYQKHLSRVHVTGSGRVVQLLPDDTSGCRHQRFIVRLPWGQTILIAHNIDVAPRVTDLKPGDYVKFSGEYEWNPKGGVVHWTHHPPHGRHIGGWVRHNGHTYE